MDILNEKSTSRHKENPRPFFIENLTENHGFSGFFNFSGLPPGARKLSQILNEISRSRGYIEKIAISRKSPFLNEKWT